MNDVRQFNAFMSVSTSTALKLWKRNAGQKKARYLSVRAEIQTLEGVGGDNGDSTAMQQIVEAYFCIPNISEVHNSRKNTVARRKKCN